MHFSLNVIFIFSMYMYLKFTLGYRLFGNYRWESQKSGWYNLCDILSKLTA